MGNVFSTDPTIVTAARDIGLAEQRGAGSAWSAPAQPAVALGPELAVSAAIPVEGEALDLVGILSAVQETAYLWDIATDAISWEHNAAPGARRARSPTKSQTGPGVPVPDRARTHRAPPRRDRRRQSRQHDHRHRLSRAIPLHCRAAGAATPRCGSKIMAAGGPAPTASPRARAASSASSTSAIRKSSGCSIRSDHDELTGQLNRIRLSEALDAIVQRVAAHAPAVRVPDGRRQQSRADQRDLRLRHRRRGARRRRQHDQGASCAAAIRSAATRRTSSASS